MPCSLRLTVSAKEKKNFFNFSKSKPAAISGSYHVKLVTIVPVLWSIIRDLPRLDLINYFILFFH